MAMMCLLLATDAARPCGAGLPEQTILRPRAGRNREVGLSAGAIVEESPGCNRGREKGLLANSAKEYLSASREGKDVVCLGPPATSPDAPIPQHRKRVTS